MYFGPSHLLIDIIASIFGWLGIIVAIVLLIIIIGLGIFGILFLIGSSKNKSISKFK